MVLLAANTKQRKTGALKLCLLRSSQQHILLSEVLLFLSTQTDFLKAKTPHREWKTLWEMKIEREGALQAYCCSYKFVFMIFILLHSSQLAF